MKSIGVEWVFEGEGCLKLVLQRSLREIIQRGVFKRLDDDKIITTDIELPIA